MRLLSFAVLALAAACASAPPPKPPPPVPELGPVELSSSQGLTDFKLSLQTSLKPAEAAHLLGARVEMVVDGNVVKATDVALDKALPAGEATPVELTESGRYVNTAEELTAFNAQGGSLKAALRGEFTVRHGEVTQKVEFARARDIRVPRLPKVKAKDAEGGKHSDEEVQVVLYFQVENPNPFPLQVSKLSYTATMLGKQMAERSEGGEKIAASSTDTFEVRFPFDASTWGKDVKAKIKAGTLPWTLNGKLEGELFSVPFELSGTLKLSSK
ncbi:MAG: LEA type 2 family protein [Deltaproteobacteria bacterium]|nr:LEA type 2 family protein [Deltaproteobacteria bacterium]